VFGIALRPLGNGVGDDTVAENVGEVLKVGRESLGSHGVHGERLRGWIVRVRPHQSLQTLLQLGLRLRLNLVESRLVARSSQFVENEDTFSMEPMR